MLALQCALGLLKAATVWLRFAPYLRAALEYLMLLHEFKLIRMNFFHPWTGMKLRLTNTLVLRKELHMLLEKHNLL